MDRFLVANAYFNVSLVFRLRSCHPSTTPHLNAAEFEEEDEHDQHEADFSDFTSSLKEVVSWLIDTGGSEEERTDNTDYSLWEMSDDCQDIIYTDVGGAVSAVSLVKIVTGVMVVLSLSVVLFPKVWRKLSGWVKKEPSDVVLTTKENRDIQDKKDETEVSSIGAVGSELRERNAILLGPKSNVPLVIPVGSAGRGSQSMDTPNFVSRPDSSQFLRHTVDHMSAQLDSVLGLTAADPSSPTTQSMSAATASLATPRLQRKGSIRRPRWRTVVSLPFESADLSSDDKMTLRMWQRVVNMERRMDWMQMDSGDLDINVIQDSRLSAILQFYQQTCPVRVEQWSASCLIVNYVLTLLEQELISCTSDRSPLKVLELRSFGSAANETCIGRANRFNVMLTLQLPFCSEMMVYDCEVCDDIPAGKVVVGMKEVGGGDSLLVQKDRVGDCFGSFLSVREVVRACQKLVTNAVERLKLKSKSLLDRLSFSMRLDQYNDLLLCIDTRLLSGLGLSLSDITVRLTPALQVSSEESNPLPPLYAVPSWNHKPVDNSDDLRQRIQSRIMRTQNQGAPCDLLWQLNCCELTKSFMSSAKRKLTSAGVSGCQVMCQQILRALFSRCGKDTLLTTGELHPHVLDSVVFFLLLESPASSWSLSCLPDRFSDCIHFLRSAVQSSWMPGFLLHNPHLLKQMPVLKLLPLLSSRRQENLLASVGSDEVENILSFMESRLQETGLRRCVKDDYSTEMWEYEFFIFG